MAKATSAAALVALHHISFQFDNGSTLFDSLDLSFDRTPTGIVGRNGVGKSLLAQLIAGRIEPTYGSVQRSVQVSIAAQQHVNAICDSQTVADVTGLDAPIAALTRLTKGMAEQCDFDVIGERWDLVERLRNALNTAGLENVAPQTPAGLLSDGQLARVTLIGALLSDAGMLVLDEPTNHLDVPGRAWLRTALSRWRGGLIVISHDRGLLADMQRIIELTPKGIRSYGGNYEAYRRQRDAQQDAAQHAFDHIRTTRDRVRRRLHREHDTIQHRAAGLLRELKTANVSSSERAALKSSAREVMGHVRAVQRERNARLDQRVQEASAGVESDVPVLVSLPGSEVSAGRKLFTLDDVRLPWSIYGEPAASIAWSACGPVRIALTGPNGCGKSTLLRLIAGHLAPHAGHCMTHVSYAFLDQKLALLDPDRSIIEQLGLLDSPLAEGELRSRLALLRLDAKHVTQPTRHLSGGERLKAALACALWRGTPAQLLLLDEPTNHLDLESVRALEAALADFPGALIVVSHDVDFIAALAPTHTMQWGRDGWCYDPVS